MKAIVQTGQTLLDLALRECGSDEGVFPLASRNGLSITDALEPGQVLEVAPEDVVNQEVVDYYKAKNILPATELETPLEEGIEFWAIEYDFIVS